MGSTFFLSLIFMRQICTASWYQTCLNFYHILFHWRTVKGSGLFFFSTVPW
jgi:hypothetical protein